MSNTIKSYCNIEMVDESKWTSTFSKYLFNLQNNIYVDPDGNYDSEKNHEFYELLTTFLNDREEEFVKRYKHKTKWRYEFVEDSGIKVIVGKGAESEKLLTLRSDLFGFSCPNDLSKLTLRYPYGEYILSGENIDLMNRCEDVCKWIYHTRTIGGSFLWPITEQGDKKVSKYNMKRGVRGYIQDRVDLTLLEIKSFYEVLKNGNLYDEIKIECDKRLLLLRDTDSLEIFEWLSHFETFENYVEFFHFESFCKEDEKGKYIPRSIIEGFQEVLEYDFQESLADKRARYCLQFKHSDRPNSKAFSVINYNNQESDYKRSECIKRMLDSLIEKIADRTKKIS